MNSRELGKVPRILERKKFASLLRGGRVNSGEVLRGLDSQLRQELDPHRQQGGPRVAPIVSIVETCRRLNIPIRDYLSSVLPGLADRPMSQTAKPTPGAWAKRNALATPATFVPI